MHSSFSQQSSPAVAGPMSPEEGKLIVAHLGQALLERIASADRRGESPFDQVDLVLLAEHHYSSIQLEYLSNLENWVKDFEQVVARTQSRIIGVEQSWFDESKDSIDYFQDLREQLEEHGKRLETIIKNLLIESPEIDLEMLTTKFQVIKHFCETRPITSVRPCFELFTNWMNIEFDIIRKSELLRRDAGMTRDEFRATELYAVFRSRADCHMDRLNLQFARVNAALVALDDSVNDFLAAHKLGEVSLEEKQRVLDSIKLLSDVFNRELCGLAPHFSIALRNFLNHFPLILHPALLSDLGTQSELLNLAMRVLTEEYRWIEFSLPGIVELKTREPLKRNEEITIDNLSLSVNAMSLSAIAIHPYVPDTRSQEHLEQIFDLQRERSRPYIGIPVLRNVCFDRSLGEGHLPSDAIIHRLVEIQASRKIDPTLHTPQNGLLSILTFDEAKQLFIEGKASLFLRTVDGEIMAFALLCDDENNQSKVGSAAIQTYRDAVPSKNRWESIAYALLMVSSLESISDHHHSDQLDRMMTYALSEQSPPWRTQVLVGAVREGAIPNKLDPTKRWGYVSLGKQIENEDGIPLGVYAKQLISGNWWNGAESKITSSERKLLQNAAGIANSFFSIRGWRL